MTQPVLGIDIAKDTFDVCLLLDDKHRPAQFENNLAGFKKLSRWMSKFVQVKVHACLEPTGQYGEALAEYLFQQEQDVSIVNPARIKAYGRSKLRRNKTDKADAELIALYGLREQPTLWTPPPASFKDLQALVRRYEDLQAMYQQENNRLKSGTRQPDVIADLQEHLAYLEQKLSQSLQAIQDHIQSHAELKQRQELLLSIPGIGKLTAAKLLAEIREIDAFEDARQLAAYAGVTPGNFVSGSSIHKKAHMTKMGNTNLRKALYMPAISAKRHNPIVHAFCDRLLAAGLRPKQVIGAAMRKLLHLVFGILKSGKPFDPNFLDNKLIAS
ncbi:MAG: IS110 family transposase [Anaerolineaceae bacterium]|nr:IS110 family transposase [Anaerolineaceae bacterium]